MTTEETNQLLFRDGFLTLLRIKDSDIRIMCLEQGRDAVDRGIHIGGAFSAIVPLVSLYYGGTMRYSVEDPTMRGRDLFVLSKGHAVAALASIYADLGYIDRRVLADSRSADSILNGHPGPLLPGIHIATGPEGHGMAVAQGFALAGKEDPRFDVYCLTGDGEIQAGMIWEAVMFAGAKKLDNFCVLVDKNEGQLDNPRALAFPMIGVERWFDSFGWRVITADAVEYDSVVDAVEMFRRTPRDGRPTAVICHTRKGAGGFSSFCVSHKGEISPELAEQEIELQKKRRSARAESFREILGGLSREKAQELSREALRMKLFFDSEGKEHPERASKAGISRVLKAAPRDKRVPYNFSKFPEIDKAGSYAASWVISECMKELGKSGMVATVDADLASTSGLEGGLSWSDSTRAFNVGVAESNMLNIGESLAVLGYNTWVSTFCPFFDWRVIRRIAIGYQERAEVIASGGWLSEGHNLDLVFLATAPNFDTRTNGSTHMGNDDSLLFSEIAHLKIVDISCPNQLIGFIRWIMKGGNGLVYARVMRALSGVLYDSGFEFDYGTGYRLLGGEKDEGTIISSGREVHEAVQAARILEGEGIPMGVIDMPSFDANLMEKLRNKGKPLIIAEQNNGYLLKRIREQFFPEGPAAGKSKILPINTVTPSGDRQFIHSATYNQLLDRFGLSPEQLVVAVKKVVKQG